MDKNKAEIKLSFDPTKSELVSVKLRVSFQRDRRRYSFPVKEGILITRDEFEKLLGYHQTKNGRTAEKIRLLYSELEPYLLKAEALTKTIHPFSFEAFKDAFYSTTADIDPSEADDVFAAFSRKVSFMKQQGRIGNAQNYELAANSLRKFLLALTESERRQFTLPTSRSPAKVDRPNPPLLRFRNLTQEFFMLYEQWMTSHLGNSLTTVGIYCRHIRAVFNDAIEAGVIDRNHYPFGKNRYVIPAGSNTKKALSKEDIKKLMAYECLPTTMEQRGRDLWVFSYFSNGMNINDICRLRWSDIDKEGSTLTFIRQKTARSRKGHQSKIRVNLFPESWNIIERWAQPATRLDAFVFPFLPLEATPEQQKKVIKQVVKLTNSYMRGIAKLVDVKGEVNTYAARHSFATILLQSEVPIAFISQALGHTNIKTTESYLGSFDDEKTKKYFESLL